MLVNSLSETDNDVEEEEEGVYEVFREMNRMGMDGCVIRWSSSRNRKRKKRRKRRMK